MKFFFTRSLFIVFICFAVFKSANAQVYTPFTGWNHAGIGGVYLQPASIADTRLKFDMTFFGLDINVGNSLYGLKKGFITGGNFDENFDDYKVPLTGINNHRALISAEVQALNFMVPLSPKSALGFTARARWMINVDGIDPNMFDIIEDPGDFTDNNKKYTISDLAFRTNAWAETGITYAREIFDLDKHYLKAGLTVKLLQPVTSAYMYIEKAGYELISDTPVGSVDPDDYVKLQAKGELAFPAGFNDFEDFTDPSLMFDDFKIGKNLGVGFDFGLVYEYRPDHANYTQSGSGRSKWNRYEPSKYLFRIGLSILDVGSMKYNASMTQSFNMPAPQEILEDDITNLEDLENLFGLQQKQTQYRVALPTAISLQTDWRINRTFYLGVNPYMALRQKKGNKVGTHYVTSINVAPRLEMAGLGLSIPMTYDQFKAFNVGIGLRLGPLWVGSNNAFNVLVSDKLREVNVCVALRMSLYHRNSGSKSKQTITEGID